MSMDFSTSIQNFNTEFNLNAVKDYNNFLQKQDSFQFDNDVSEFSKILDNANKSIPLKDNTDPYGLGNFMEKLGSSLGGGLDAVNKARLEADRMQEDLAMGGPTSIHDAMIAAEKAQLSMQMAIQIRNRILTAYTEINSMAL